MLSDPSADSYLLSLARLAVPVATLLYTRRGCHLCDQAEDLLATLGLVATCVDVDGDQTVAARYGLRVPVLEIDGVVVMEGRFDGRRLAEAVPPALRPRGTVRGPATGPATGPD